MYFIELLVKKFKREEKDRRFYDPMQEEKTEDESCEHVFMPIDSTGETLACKHCGLLVKRKDLKDINFFRHPNPPGS